MSNPEMLTFTEASALLERKEVSAYELAEIYLRAIEEKDAAMHAYLEVFDDVREQARQADERRTHGETGALLGVPIAMKDNILIQGKQVSAASKMLSGYRATYDATVVRKLKAAGAVFLGRTNMDEFAMGGSTEHSAYGPTKNPRDTSRVAGGSSGGSAAAVAAGLAPAALGSDTGGSVRQPASFCGVVGLKPTYGSVSRHGLIAMGSSLDVIGPLTKTVGDAQLLHAIIRGHDPLDGTSLPDTNAHTHPGTPNPQTIGVPRDFLEAGLDADVRAVFDARLGELEKAGHEIVDISLPLLKHALAVYYVLMPAEASTNLARFDGLRFGLHREGATRAEDVIRSRTEGFGKEVRRRILLGTFMLSSGYYDAYYGKAQTVRRMLSDAITKAFARVSVIATPTTPTPAFCIGEKTDPLSMYLADICTVPANLTGIPALSVPMGTVGRNGNALPIGLQLMAPHGHEALLFALGAQLEKETP